MTPAERALLDHTTLHERAILAEQETAAKKVAAEAHIVDESWEEETRCCMCNNWSAGGSRRTICRSCELDMREQAREERANRSW
jgi:hypothetical protein